MASTGQGYLTNGSLMQVKSIVECSFLSILQYFCPALSDNWSWKPIFGLFKKGRFRQVLLYLDLSKYYITNQYLRSLS